MPVVKIKFGPEAPVYFGRPIEDIIEENRKLKEQMAWLCNVVNDDLYKTSKKKLNKLRLGDKPEEICDPYKFAVTLTFDPARFNYNIPIYEGEKYLLYIIDRFVEQEEVTVYGCIEVTNDYVPHAHFLCTSQTDALTIKNYFKRKLTNNPRNNIAVHVQYVKDEGAIEYIDKIESDKQYDKVWYSNSSTFGGDLDLDTRPPIYVDEKKIRDAKVEELKKKYSDKPVEKYPKYCPCGSNKIINFK